jgi:hypothetical protein
MTSSYTTNLKIEQPAKNDYVDNWAAPINNDFNVIDASFGATTALNAGALSGPISLSLTYSVPPSSGTATAQWQCANFVVSGTPSGNVVYQILSGVGGRWSVWNNTTGSYTISFATTATGTNRSALIPQGYRAVIVSDGTNVDLESPPVLNNGSALQLIGSSTGYVGLAAPSGASGAYTYKLPAIDGYSGYVLQTDGTGNMSWTSNSTGVNTFSAGLTGLTPIQPTGGSVVLSGTLNVSNGGTGTTSATGSGSVVLSNGPALVAPALGTPISGTLTNCTFPTLNQNTTGSAAYLSDYTAGHSMYLGWDGTNILAKVDTTVVGKFALQNSYIAKAWVSFSVSGSTCNILSQTNVATVVRNSAGNYTVFFTNSIGSSNYTVSATLAGTVFLGQVYSQTATQFTFTTQNVNPTYQDVNGYCSIVIYGN